MKNQCSMRWEETPSVIPSASTASFSAPTTSRCGPISAAFQCESADLYIWNPSWCSATGTTYRAPARLKSAAHAAGSNFSALNSGIKSL